MRPHRLPFQLLLLACIEAPLLAASPQARSEELRIRELSQRALPLDTRQYPTVKVGPDESLYFFRPDPIALVRLEHGTLTPEEISISLPKIDGAANGVILLDDLAIDATGNLLFPALWRGEPRDLHASMFLLSPKGEFSRRIDLTPKVEIRRVAVTIGGDIVIVGLDTTSASANRTHILHRYGIGGVRLNSFLPFSESPEKTSWDRNARGDIDRAIVWSNGAGITVVRPFAKRLEVVNPERAELRAIVLQVPEVEGLLTASSSIWHIVQLPDNRYLIHWVLSTGSGSAAITNRSFLALHDNMGRPISAATRQPWPSSFPLYAGKDGSCYFLRHTESEGSQLVRTSVSLR